MTRYRSTSTIDRAGTVTISDGATVRGGCVGSSSTVTAVGIAPTVAVRALRCG